MRPDQYLADVRLRRKVLYYPGSGDDYGPLKLFAEHGGFKTVIYADYGMTEGKALQFLEKIPGWTPGGRPKLLKPKDLSINTWEDCWPRSRASRAHSSPEKAFAIRVRLVSSSGLAVKFLFLATEAIRTYSVLAGSGLLPTAVVLQDHGLGGGWAPFGGDSKLYKQAHEHLPLPKLLFVAERNEPWPGYEKVSGFHAYPGSTYKDRRAIYELEG